MKTLKNTINKLDTQVKAFLIATILLTITFSVMVLKHGFTNF